MSYIKKNKIDNKLFILTDYEKKLFINSLDNK